MKKIPTLFTRVFYGRKIVGITDKITPGCEEAFLHGTATKKFDGSCCAIIDGRFYKRYNAKAGRKPPEGAIPCCDPDPVTGHWPHWIEIDPDDPANKWFADARTHTEKFLRSSLPDGTYEAVGRHFNGNPYGLDHDYLWAHGNWETNVPRTFEGVKEWLTTHKQEGLVFWLNGEPVCKIKRSDFGLEWPIR